MLFRSLRNATLTTIAPTGTLSLIAGCSGGIEPIYGIRTRRLAMGNLFLEDLHPLITAALRRAGIRDERLLRDLTSRGSIQSEARIPRKIRALFPTAHDISPDFHVRIQAAFQKYTDNAVAKTVNFPENAGPGEIKKAFLLAYREGCKGITVFRSGSRAGQILSCSDPDYC